MRSSIQKLSDSSDGFNDTSFFLRSKMAKKIGDLQNNMICLIWLICLIDTSSFFEVLILKFVFLKFNKMFLWCLSIRQPNQIQSSGVYRKPWLTKLQDSGTETSSWGINPKLTYWSMTFGLCFLVSQSEWVLIGVRIGLINICRI